MTRPKGPIPVYVEIADAIAARIESGELAPNDPIPSEKTIEQEFGCARGTARRAVQELRDRDLVYTVPQRGTFVKAHERR